MYHRERGVKIWSLLGKSVRLANMTKLVTRTLMNTCLCITSSSPVSNTVRSLLVHIYCSVLFRELESRRRAEASISWSDMLTSTVYIKSFNLLQTVHSSVTENTLRSTLQSSWIAPHPLLFVAWESQKKKSHSFTHDPAGNSTDIPLPKWLPPACTECSERLVQQQNISQQASTRTSLHLELIDLQETSQPQPFMQQ